MIAKGQALLQDVALIIYDLPSYLLRLLLGARFELRRRIRAKRKHLAVGP